MTTAMTQRSYVHDEATRLSSWVRQILVRPICFFLPSKKKSTGFVTYSHLLPQQFYHPCVYLPTYVTLMRSRRMRYLRSQKFCYKIMSYRSSAYFPSERLCDILLPSVRKLINLSSAEGIFPKKFKKLVVTPHIKKASLPSEDLKNYHLMQQ